MAIERALVRGADWAQVDTKGANTDEFAPALATETCLSGPFVSGR
jgi:hypothetical protein